MWFPEQAWRDLENCIIFIFVQNRKNIKSPSLLIGIDGFFTLFWCCPESCCMAPSPNMWPWVLRYGPRPNIWARVLTRGNESWRIVPNPDMLSRVLRCCTESWNLATTWFYISPRGVNLTLFCGNLEIVVFSNNAGTFRISRSPEFPGNRQFVAFASNFACGPDSRLASYKLHFPIKE